MDYAVGVCLHPVGKCGRYALYGVDRALRRSLAVEDALCVFLHLLLGLEDGDGLASAVWMPPHEFEVLGIFPCQLIANVGQPDGLPFGILDGVVAAQPDLDADDEVHLLPS
ncbi:MAG: hypothetical protein ACI304_04585 [Lepagella sp.]